VHRGRARSSGVERSAERRRSRRQRREPG
jgi:hypothetical protein